MLLCNKIIKRPRDWEWGVVVVLARPSKRPRHDVWCAGIVLHASSLLLSRPAAHSEHGGMCRPSERARERKEKDDGKSGRQSKVSWRLYLFVCQRVAGPGHWRLHTMLSIHIWPLWVCSAAACRTHHGSQLWLWINIFLHLLPDCSAGRSSRMDKRSLDALEPRTGGTRSIFSDRPQSETDSQQLVSRLYWLKTTAMAIKTAAMTMLLPVIVFVCVILDDIFHFSTIERRVFPSLDRLSFTTVLRGEKKKFLKA